MGPRRRVVGIAVVAAALGVLALGVGGAVAQSDAPPSGTSPADLMDRLAELEVGLPVDPPPTDVTLAADTTWGTLAGDAASTRAVLDTLEADLRALFVDADDADGDVAEAVALVARGWLDIWTGTASIAAAESHDLAFPLATFDNDGVATGADELRGEIEVGLELILQGRLRLLEGYTSLRELGEADLAEQSLFDGRAGAAERFDEEVRPLVVLMLSQPTATVAVPTERFTTAAPGVESRASAMHIMCVDRAALEELGGTPTPEVLAQIGEVSRADCPELPLPELDD